MRKAKAHLARKEAKARHINICLSDKRLIGLKDRAEEVGIPYQTLAASVLHQVAMGKIKMELVRTAKTSE